MRKQGIKVCVIVPVYKVEKYLKKCVDSLINQTYQNLEIILVDDGSPDDCPRICDQYDREYENIIALHKENGGLSDARNFGVNHTNCEWIAFVDSDDYVEPAYIETLVALREKYDAEMVITRATRENEDGSGKQRHVRFDDFLAGKIQALKEVYAGSKVGWYAYGKLISRDILLKHPFPNGYYEDCACMYRIIEELDRIAIGDYETNYHYIQRDGSILCSPLQEKHLHIFEIAEEFEAFIREVHPDLEILTVILYRRAVIQLLNLQSMPWKTYKSIFMKYRPLFRKNLKKIMQDESATRNSKIYYLLLCSRPEMFYLHRKLLRRRR